MPCLRATTLVVDQKASSAADGNPGTRARPFRTIGAAALAVRPGDTVLVRPGLYTVAVELTVSGTQAQPITLQSETPGAAMIDGSDVVRTSTRRSRPKAPARKNVFGWSVNPNEPNSAGTSGWKTRPLEP